MSRNFANFRYTKDNSATVDAHGVIHCNLPDGGCAHMRRMHAAVLLRACLACLWSMFRERDCCIILAWALTLFVLGVSGNAKASGHGADNRDPRFFVLHI